MAVSAAAREARRRQWPGAAAWALWALTMLGLAVGAWLDHLLRQAGMPELGMLQAASAPLLAAAVSAATVGAVLASRRPAHPVGWLMLGIGLLVTPTGSLPSPRWRWWARVAAAAPLLLVLLFAVDPHPLAPEHPTVDNPLAVPVPAGVLLAVAAVDAVIVLATLVAAAGSLVVRFRRARGTERQQLRWVAVGAAVVGAVALLVGVVAGAMAKDRVVLAALGTCVALLPLATGAAILRYRLYDLDRIISRTLAYGLLTVLLGGGYAGVVLGLGQLLGRDSSLVVAGATLAVAAAFQPARRRIQRAVDRRFNRRRYDAARTIQAFSARLRQQVDLEALTGELLAVVEQPMQPPRASLWLRPPPHDSSGTPREAQPTTWAY